MIRYGNVKVKIESACAESWKMKKIHSISQRVVIIDAFHAYLLLSSSSALSSSLFRPSVDFFSAVFQTVYDTAQTHWAAAAAAPPNTKLSTNTTEKEKRERRIRNPGCSTETIRFVSEALLDIDQRFSLSLSLLHCRVHSPSFIMLC